MRRGRKADAEAEERKVRRREVVSDVPRALQKLLLDVEVRPYGYQSSSAFITGLKEWAAQRIPGRSTRASTSVFSSSGHRLRQAGARIHASPQKEMQHQSRPARIGAQSCKGLLISPRAISQGRLSTDAITNYATDPLKLSNIPSRSNRGMHSSVFEAIPRPIWTTDFARGPFPEKAEQRI
ncbi:hypothetical protein NUW54_g3534 [Trametes sanguinea]|uniref:Uncharacterized protein n=1 Tax=Trametes sanguinea TaxID=158606 RepID=A0ACC1Q1R9_9APHY|nr:hypothetical protein NUW54_g3534 [Trametes sanguinea]